MPGSLDDSDIRLIDGREMLLLVAVDQDGTTRAGFNGVSLSDAVRLLRELADQWERQASAEDN